MLAKMKTVVCAVLLCGASHAATIDFQFNATLTTGALAGDTFAGTGSYSNQGETGIGAEYFTLTSLNFTLLGVSFTKADIDQGGQAILENGVLATFTAAFFPPPPSGSPVDDIAFGFGGPDVIGYSTPPGNNFGFGSFAFASTPEPGSEWLLLVGVLLVAARKRNRRSA